VPSLSICITHGSLASERFHIQRTALPRIAVLDAVSFSRRTRQRSYSKARPPQTHDVLEKEAIGAKPPQPRTSRIHSRQLIGGKKLGDIARGLVRESEALTYRSAILDARLSLPQVSRP